MKDINKKRSQMAEQEPQDDARKLAYEIIQAIENSTNYSMEGNSTEGSVSENSEASSWTCICPSNIINTERRALYTLVPVEIDGRVEILAVPPVCRWCSKFLGSDRIYSSRAFRGMEAGESSVWWPGEVFENKTKRSGHFLGSSSVQNSSKSNLSSFLPSGFDFGSTSSDATNKGKSWKKNVKKKSKKKGKQKNRNRNTGASECESPSGERVLGSSTSEFCDNSDMVQAEVSGVCSAGHTQCKQKRCNKGMQSKALSNMHSVSGDCNGNDSLNLRQDVETLDQKCSNSCISEPQESCPRHGHFSNPTLSDGVVYANHQPDETQGDTQNCSTTDMQWTVVGKKKKQKKKVHKSSLGNSLSNENGQSVCNPCTQQASDDYSASRVEDIELHSVDEECWLHLKQEALKISVGGPVAEFEKLMDLFSPVICRPPSAAASEVTRNQAVGTSLYKDETPNFFLKDLWEWYETPGSFGLTIKAADCKSSKVGASYNAHFIPFLSAVQLFGNNSPIKSDASCEETPGEPASSSISAVAPQPCTEGTDSSLHLDQLCRSESCGESKNSIRSVLSEEKQWHCDYELLFEYFESEQPWKRRPFYRRIQELVESDGPSNRKAYGNARYLDSMKSHDLHPRSWYAVAWYPHSTIPDGRSPGAFLTYHSLGHIVNKSIPYATTAEAFIASPVVGLQIHSAQDKCWFHPRPSELEERLKRLEETASLMARSLVKKEEITSANRHPDFEFFFSKRMS